VTRDTPTRSRTTHPNYLDGVKLSDVVGYCHKCCSSRLSIVTMSQVLQISDAMGPSTWLRPSTYQPAPICSCK
jgi:hypothetical protein